MVSSQQELLPQQREELILILKNRFEKNMQRHKELLWPAVQAKLESNPAKLRILDQMETTGGEPDVTGYDQSTDQFVFTDCVAESPKGRRSICYDQKALESRKEHKPAHSAIGMAAEMGIDLLTEAQYRELQLLGHFDAKTSSWIQTPDDIRSMGGAIFADYRYGKVFVYHNGAESYYAARGFRGSLKV